MGMWGFVKLFLYSFFPCIPATYCTTVRGKINKLKLKLKLSWDASLDTGQIAAKQSGCHDLRTTKKAWFRYGQ